MRKIKKMMVTVVTMMAIAMSLTGCGNLFREDDKHATVSVTTSDGQAYVFQSVNGSNCTVSGKEKALRECKFNLNLKTGETAHIVLKCEACGKLMWQNHGQTSFSVIVQRRLTKTTMLGNMQQLKYHIVRRRTKRVSK